MTESSYPNYSEQLRQLMAKVDIPSFRQLSLRADVSELQLRRLRKGQVSQMQLKTLLKLAEALQVSLNQLLVMFLPDSVSTLQQEDSTFKQEYQRLEQQLEQQRETLMQEFQQSSLQVLESWLVQWPTAAYAAQQNEQLPAVRLLPLVKPVEQLLEKWGVEAIASVGQEIPYDPQQHQLMSGSAQPGDRVRVRYTGYRIGDKLLHRAKVSPV
ncbi:MULTISPECIES: nucleotide exchange factor GrpE [unclassified Moorena]|uniref:nucleotide exchange factor GrpE n=1 Tax=unclassified Moorena TaxID=2683338 RepID=UPI0013B611AF|nr:MULTISPECIES: nucleotide exchange factor GrpE [unclassified Moorena]NEQ05644.1 nucleotide exchange factor GrpE [Moorena sp. SIO4E2]NEQ17083.1 nucleotide exchange factor GrpE [Moorena sp. SIO3E2]NES41752.1 nucleotide exchange factor GrpE [Moorena sp. SIO2C4]